MVMEPPMEQPTLIGHPRHLEEPEFDLNEWARMRLENTRRRRNSRRYSASFIGTFTKDDEPANKSLRSNFTISSTTSSPGYNMRGLKAKSVYGWDQMSPELGLALNSKWSEAERYICNPLSGEVPLECLSAKTLSGRSFHQFASRISTSTPVIHPLPPRHLLRKPSIAIHEDGLKFRTQDKTTYSRARDAGNESPPPVMDSSHPSPVTPSIEERVIQCNGAESEDSLESSENRKFGGEVGMKEANEEEECRERKEGDNEECRERKEGENDQNGSKKTTSTPRRGGCFPSWSALWKKRNQESNNILKTRKHSVFIFHKIGCLKRMRIRDISKFLHIT